MREFEIKESLQKNKRFKIIQSLKVNNLRFINRRIEQAEWKRDEKQKRE